MTSINLAAAKVIGIPDPPPWHHLDLDFTDNIDLNDLRHQALNKGYSLPAVNPDSYLDPNGINYHQRTLIKNNQQEQASWNMMCLMDLDWAHRNVCPTATDMRFTFSIPGRRSLGPHTDRSRAWVKIYVITGGSDDHRTVFYKEKNCGELSRPLRLVIDEYDSVQEIGSIQLPDRTWILLRTRTASVWG